MACMHMAPSLHIMTLTDCWLMYPDVAICNTKTDIKADQTVARLQGHKYCTDTLSAAPVVCEAS